MIRLNTLVHISPSENRVKPLHFVTLTLLQVLQNYYWNKRNYTAVTLGKANAMTVVPNQYGCVNMRCR